MRSLSAIVGRDGQTTDDLPNSSQKYRRRLSRLTRSRIEHLYPTAGVRRGVSVCTIKLAVYGNALRRQGALYELRYSSVHMAMRPTASIYEESSLLKCNAQ
jgi:hypothetical protein